MRSDVNSKCVENRKDSINIFISFIFKISSKTKLFKLIVTVLLNLKHM